MTHRKQLERRTFLQDRFELLIKRQEKGEATFSELTELDNIVNANPEIRNKIILENMLIEGTDDFNRPTDITETSQNPLLSKMQKKSLLKQVRSFLSRIFNLRAAGLKHSPTFRFVMA